ncbi:MAG TPA: DUF3891 family protein [Acidobacteriaceae bacterium]
MLRMKDGPGWWLVTHPDHARLAGEFAAAWGNAEFRAPEPRERVLYGIRSHDDGWAERDKHPSVTREGKPSAFSTELVGKYSAFEEIDLSEYLAVRERAVKLIGEQDAYAGLLVALHTYNLLTERADRSTIKAEQLPLLDAFLEGQRAYQAELRERIAGDVTLSDDECADAMIQDHFRLLQACDNLSLLTCVAFDKPAHLLHPLRRNDVEASEVRVTPVGVREFRLEPWPFAETELRFTFPARFVEGERFADSLELETAFVKAPVEVLEVVLRR